MTEKEERRKKRSHVQNLMKYNPDKIIIESECLHPGKKERHHPDYDKPFNVALLCVPCHRTVHAKPKKQRKTVGTVAANIRKFRIEAGLNQHELADKLGLFPQQISKWERGQKLTVDTLQKLAKVLNKQPDDFFVDGE